VIDEADHRLLRIFIGESDTHDGRPLHQEIVETMRTAGLAGVTVLRGIAGFGKSSRLHTAHILRLSEDLPIVIECVDTYDRIEAVFPKLDEMIGDGLVTMERVQVRVYRAGEDRPPQADSR
jgi:PII-like signaling protein